MFSALAAARQPRARWSALASFTFEAALVAAALAYPLFYPESLPSRERPLFLAVPSASPAAARADSSTPAQAGGPTLPAPVLVAGRRLSLDGRSLPAADPVALPDIRDLGQPNSVEVFDSLVPGGFHVMPRRAPAGAPSRVSAVMEGNLIHRVEPQYPAFAKQLGIQGTVVVKAFISREGAIERAQVERGQAWLAEAALAAVRQWRYRPYYLNREPVEVETEITVNFVLER